MESLSEDIWDIVIAGTGLQQSLLALSLSRSGKKVLHLDRNEWYGGIDAGLSLNDVDTWVRDLGLKQSHHFSGPIVSNFSVDGNNTTLLRPSRSYTLALTPQIIYAKSAFLPTLVSSKIALQLEFVAVGSFYVLNTEGLRKIPSTREDVFNDDSLSVRDKRSLMKFLRFVLQEEEVEENPQNEATLEQLLENYRIPASLRSAVQALALSTQSAANINAATSVRSIRRHLQSIGHLGPGFGAVVAKYGSNPEIAQVACRAQAVGGGVYLLGHGIASIESGAASVTPASENEERLRKVTLTDGTAIRTRRLIGGLDDLPDQSDLRPPNHAKTTTAHSINVISDSLKPLFAAPSENGPTPAVAMVFVEPQSVGITNPIHLQIHSEDTGECPSGQTIIYASVQSEDSGAPNILQEAVQRLLSHMNIGSPDHSAPARVLWNLSFTSKGSQNLDLDALQDGLDHTSTVVLEPTVFSPIVDDRTLDVVRRLWQDIAGHELSDDQFLRFEDREDGVDDDGD